MTQFEMIQSAVSEGRGMDVILALRKVMWSVGVGRVDLIRFARASMSFVG